MDTRNSSPNSSDDATIRDAAAQWVVRHDRRLSAAESAEFEAWVGADPRHAAAYAQSVSSWRLFRELGTVVSRTPAPVPALRSRWSWPVMGSLAAAAALVALIMGSLDRPSRFPVAVGQRVTNAEATMDVAKTRYLADGSTVRLKTGAEMSVAFSPSERRIRLLRGEAFFAVVKDATRPFFVEVGDVTVRAVGTTFAVRVEPRAVNVLVTEGTVQVTPPALPSATHDRPAAPNDACFVNAGHRAVVVSAPNREARPILVTPVSRDEIARALAWNEQMLDLADSTLEKLVPEFAKRSGRRIEIGDAALNAVRIGGRFPTDDVEGFIRALEEIYDIKSERRADGSIVLMADR